TAFSVRWAVRQRAARLIVVNSTPSRLERQAELSVRVREGGESALVYGLLDGSRVGVAAGAMGADPDSISAIRKILLESEKVVVIFGDELRGVALEALPLLEIALATPNAEAAVEARKSYVDALQRQVRSSNSTSKPSINENPYTYIVEHPTLEIGRAPARSE